ncbi:hypothetical protein ACHAWO_008397 [Cyclotella atomus]|uniref:Uncharacterized protein n=1 Tax=Cyclotella atomus TaxID=382360 RepID=A0ABD3PYW6_9STRA
MSQRNLSQSSKCLAKSLSSASPNSDQQIPVSPGLSTSSNHASFEAMSRNFSSLSLHKLLSAPSSSSSFKQFDLQRGLNSSSLESNKVLPRSLLCLTMRGATWDAGLNMLLQKTSVLTVNDEPNRPLDLSSHSMSYLLSVKDEAPKYREQETCDKGFEAEYLVKKFAEKPINRLNLLSMSSTELDSLEQDDGFVYYSIPGVRKVVLQGYNVDLENIKRSGSVVERRSRITTESIYMIDYAYTDEPTPDEGSVGMDFDNVDEEDDSYLSYLKHLMASNT